MICNLFEKTGLKFSSYFFSERERGKENVKQKKIHPRQLKFTLDNTIF